MIEESDITRIFKECDKLINVPVPYDDLLDCVIGRDIADEDEDLALTLYQWVLDWVEVGYTEVQAVNIFYALVTLIQADKKAADNMESLMEDIQKYLENK